MDLKAFLYDCYAMCKNGILLIYTSILCSTILQCDTAITEILTAGNLTHTHTHNTQHTHNTHTYVHTHTLENLKSAIFLDDAEVVTCPVKD